MRAVLCKAYGPPETLVIEEVASAAVGAGDVRVRVHACGVNFPDTLLLLHLDSDFGPWTPDASPQKAHPTRRGTAHCTVEAGPVTR